jgi:hypothetical protein
LIPTDSKVFRLQRRLSRSSSSQASDFPGPPPLPLATGRGLATSPGSPHHFGPTGFFATGLVASLVLISLGPASVAVRNASDESIINTFTLARLQCRLAGLAP